MHGDFNLMCVRLLELQSQCYIKIKDTDSAIRYLEQKLKI